MKRFIILILSTSLLTACPGGSGGSGGGQNPTPNPDQENALIKVLKPKLEDVHNSLLQMERQSNLAPDRYYRIRGWDLYKAVAAAGIPEGDLQTPAAENILYLLTNLIGEPSGAWKESINSDSVIRKLIYQYNNGGRP